MTKYFRFIYLTALVPVLLAGCTGEATRHLPEGAVYLTEPTTYSPHAGVICDEPGEGLADACFDRYGISLGLTEVYLGHTAQDRVMAMIKEAGDSFNSSLFTLSDGVTCDAKRRKCWHGRANPDYGTPAPRHTKALFGS